MSDDACTCGCNTPAPENIEEPTCECGCGDRRTADAGERR